MVKSIITLHIGYHYLHVHVLSHIAFTKIDGDDVHANSPLDSALISQAAGGTQSTTDDKEPGDETGVGESKCNNIFNLLLCYVHMLQTPKNPFNLVTCMYTHTHKTYMPRPSLAIPPTKKPRIQKKSKAEKALEKAMESFMTHQQAAEERYQKQDNEHWKEANELEERRRKEDREHDMRMMMMLGEMFQGGTYQSGYTRQYDYDF